MSQKITLIVYSVKDLVASKSLFATFLGTQPYVDSSYYVGFRVDDQEIGLVPNSQSNTVQNPISYVEVSDIKSSLQTLVDTGAEVQQDVKDVGQGKLVATVKDANGTILGLMQSPKS